MGRGVQGDMAFCAEKAGSRIEADPPRTRQIDFRPRMQVAEIDARTLRSVERVDVGLQLNEISGHEARRESEMSRDLHQQPRSVAARAGRACQRFLGLLHAGFHADDIADPLLQLRIELDQHVNSASGCFGKRCKQRG